jgi:hypothetical protein
MALFLGQGFVGYPYATNVVLGSLLQVAISVGARAWRILHNRAHDSRGTGWRRILHPSIDVQVTRSQPHRYVIHYSLECIRA